MSDTQEIEYGPLVCAHRLTRAGRDEAVVRHEDIPGCRGNQMMKLASQLRVVPGVGT